MNTSMASTKKLWLVALMGFAGLASAAQPTRDALVAQPSDEIKLPPLVPRKIRMSDGPADPAGKLVKMRYGPFRLPPNSMLSVMPESAGGVKIHKPCEECYMGAFQGGLEYEDGEEANVDTGMYLHHFVLVNDNKPDWYCGLRLSNMFRSQYFYNSGNERPPVRLNSKYKFGMRVDKKDTFSAAAEIMNMSNQTKTVYSTVIYEVIPLDTPGYREATHLRIDVWQCGGSDVPAKSGAYTYTSPNYTSPYSGVILHNDGHGHDGTTKVNLHINGKIFCSSIQYYGLRPRAVQPHHIAIQHGDHNTAMQYISDAVACEDYGRLEKGDTLFTEAFYNASKFPQMVFKGHLENQMGISFLYIGRDEATLHDKLRLESRYADSFPVELNLTSGWGRGGRRANWKEPNLTSILTGYGINITGNLSAVFPNLPPDFNISDPYVEAPFPPFQFPSFNRSSRLIPDILKGFNLTNPHILEMLDGILPTFIPGLPKDFKLSNVYVPGGIIMSDLRTLMDAIRKMGNPNPLKDPFKGTMLEHMKDGTEDAPKGREGHGHHPLSKRSLFRFRRQ